MIMFGFFHRKQPADSNGGESLLISDEPKRGGGCLLRVTICACLLSF